MNLLNNNLKKILIASFLSLSLLTSCGDPVTTAVVAQVIDAGVGGTGIVRGIITGFGSVFVNGVEFEIDNANFDVDGNTISGTQADLSIGMVVTINGTVNSDGITGTATSLTYDDEIEGPISATPIIVAGSDNSQKTITIFGTTVTIDKLTTYFKGTNFNDLGVTDVVEVSGYITGNNTLTATLIKKTGDYVAGISKVELKGTVSGLNALTRQFNLSTVLVTYASNTEFDLSGFSLIDGMSVEVKGIIEADGSISADKVKLKNSQENDTPAGESFGVSGIISDFIDNSHFKINGQNINAGLAQSLSPTNALSLLADGVEVEVEGSISSNVLMVKSIEVKSNDVKISAKISALGTNSMTIAFPNSIGSLQLTLNTESQLQDNSAANIDVLTHANLLTGDYIEVDGYVSGSTIVVNNLKRDDTNDFILQGVVESFVNASSVTILGITYAVNGSTSYDINNASVNASTFYSTLKNGDTVKIKDDDTADGIADKISIEN